MSATIKYDKLGNNNIYGRFPARKLKLDEIDKLYGHKFTKEFLFNITKLSLRFVTDLGFSISISDQDLDDKTLKKIEKIINDAETDVNKTIHDKRTTLVFRETFIHCNQHSVTICSEFG